MQLFGLVAEANTFLAELASGGDQLGQTLGGGVAPHRPDRRGGREAGDHASVEAVVLSLHSRRPGELPEPVRVDADHRFAGVGQRPHAPSLIPARSFQPDRGRLERGQPSLQRGPAAGVVVHPERLARLQHGDVQPSLGHIDAHVHLCHVPDPFLAVRGHEAPRNCSGLKEHGRGASLIRGLVDPEGPRAPGRRRRSGPNLTAGSPQWHESAHTRG